MEYIFSTRGKGINVNLVRKRDEKDTGDEKEWEQKRTRRPYKLQTSRLANFLSLIPRQTPE